MPSENVAPSVPDDRRTRKRAAKRDHLLDLADELVERLGVDGVTMAALAEAADYAPASLYTYFPSRSALLAALQQRALVTLDHVAREHRAGWARSLEQLRAGRPDPDRREFERIDALAELWAFAHLFLSAPEHHPREFRLQQQLLVTPGAEATADALTVVPAAMSLLDVPCSLLVGAVACGALTAHPSRTDPLGDPLDGDLLRTFAWVAALNGALMVDSLSVGAPSTGSALGEELTGTLLAGWGADATELTTARRLCREHLVAGPTPGGLR